jgi:glycosyltransferase involved in cell wall biosynthesis
VIIPVFNGGRKIGRTLENLQEKISEIESIMWDVEFQRSKVERAILRGDLMTAVQSNASVEQQEEVLMLANGNVTGDVPRSVSNISANSAPRPSSTLPMWYEVIVVNDGSKDNTRSVVRKSSSDERIKLISYSTNMGKGYAIKQGVLHSKGKYILFIDGDGDISTDVLANYLKCMSKADIVIGSKNHPRSVVNSPRSRKVLSKCFQLFVKGILGLNVSDTQVGLKAGRGDLFRHIFEKVLVKRYAFDAEMLAIAELLDSKVVELPVNIGLDRSFRMKDIFKMALDVFGIAFRLRVMKWYQKNMEKQRPHYSPLSLLG